MNNQYYRSKYIHTQRHLKLWIYLLPVVGIFPAIWTLYGSPQSDRVDSAASREQKKVSRLSLILVLAWLSSYFLLSLGAANVTQIMSFRLLYANAIITTAYFVTCTLLMSRLGNKTLPKTDKVNQMR